ncbi:MAG: ExeA family protein [Pontibacterium sp.]
MYLGHFGLNELPFTLTPNTRFYHPLPSHQDAYNLVIVALANGDGFIKVVGEVGTGKTLLCRSLLNALDVDAYVTVYLPNPVQTSVELHRAIADELGLDANLPASRLLGEIKSALLTHARQGCRVAFLVDEAQALSREALEALRLLTNLETESQKLFQVILFGQPELDNLLLSYDLRQLNQRIVYHCCLQPLTKQQVGAYVQRRLQAAGYERPMLFSQSALDLMHRASHGVPRIVNLLAHKAMLVAFGHGTAAVSKADVERAVDDSRLTLPNAMQANADVHWMLYGGVIVLTACATFALMYWEVI